MCYSPVRLINNSRHFNEKVDKVFRTVPCGKCGECRVKLQNAFEARVYYEYLNTDQREGFTFFQTFTYNEENVPWHFGIRTFSRADIRMLTKNIRNYDKRFDNDHLKYFITCEYGGDGPNATYRPHYHALFFVCVPGVTPEWFADYLHRCWKDKGFCDTNNIDARKRHTPQERVVNAQGALSYVSKYVCKDFDFQRVLDGQERNTDAHLTIPKECIPESTLKDMLPFHRQSNGLGLSMKDMIPEEDLLSGRVSIPDSIHGTKYVSLPQYIDRKVYYNYNPEDKCFRLNDEGLRMKEFRDKYNRGYVKDSIEFIYNNLEALWSTNPEYISYKLKLESWSDAVIDINKYLNGRSLDDLAEYVFSYKDLILPDFIDHVKDLSGLSDSIRLLSRLGSDSTLSLMKYKGDSRSDESIKHYRSLIEDRLYRSYYNSRFSGFEEILRILNVVNEGYCKASQDEYVRKSVEKSRQKYLFHSLYSQPMFLRSKHQLKDAPVKFRSFNRSKVESFKEVCVKNPTTKQVETVSLAVVQDEYVLPHNLRASDFSLEVQIRAGVQLQQMPNYLQPSSPEEYGRMMSDVASYLSSQQSQALQSSESIVEPASLEAPKTE